MTAAQAAAALEHTEPRPDSAEPVLEAQNVIKRFAGVFALRGVSFQLAPGEVHALCGENGAGKSTLIKVLSGVHPHGSYEGQVVLGGKPAVFRSPRDAERAGLAVIHQELALVPELTVAENLFLGREPRRGGFIDWNALYSQASKLLEPFGLTGTATTPAGELGVGHQQLVEIAKAIGRKARILILDEPTAALSQHEVEVLLDIIRQLRSSGVACVYISHKLEEVFALADRITVLRDGHSVSTQATSSAHPAGVIRNMVGREIADLYPPRSSEPGESLLRVRGLSVARARGGPNFLHQLDFELKAGEVLGIGGLMGAGRTELLMHLFGAWGERTAGTAELLGERLERTRPADCIRRGLVLVSEDRKRYGLHLDQSVGFNLSLSRLGSLTRRGLIDHPREVAVSQARAKELSVKARDLEAPASSLSGGNQQKVVLGKALMTEPKVVLLDEPTRGIDVGAKADVYQLVRELTRQGVGVILVSSELPELIGMSHRILMLHEGHITGEFDAATTTQEALLAAAMNRHAG